MSEDFHSIRDAVRDGSYLKDSMIKLYKYRNVLRIIQPWESSPEGQRQNHVAVNEKRILIENVQSEIERRKTVFWKVACKLVLVVLGTVVAGIILFFLERHL
ncbi:MAG: hypothetical protein HY809_04070 [Nitrospirae bacterium]|nr:hypothetical protein [Nitrospirota bacterium]